MCYRTAGGCWQAGETRLPNQGPCFTNSQIIQLWYRLEQWNQHKLRTCAVEVADPKGPLNLASLLLGSPWYIIKTNRNAIFSPFISLYLSFFFFIKFISLCCSVCTARLVFLCTAPSVPGLQELLLEAQQPLACYLHCWEPIITTWLFWQHLLQF